MPKGHPSRVEQNRVCRAPAKPQPVITFDDAEDEEWFQRLPPAAQREYREQRLKGDARIEERKGFARTTRTRAMTTAGLIFFFIETCCAIPSVGHSVAAVIAGTALGALWHRIGAGRMQCMVTAVPPYAALRIAFASDSFLATAVFGMFGLLLMLSVCGIAGFARETRRADDLEY